MVSRTAIDNILHCIWWQCQNRNTASAEWLYEAIKWYIGSGRASVQFLRLLIALDDEDIRRLIDKCGKSTDSTEGYIRKVCKFLNY